MSDRLEKLYTLTDIENPPEAPVTIEAGGLIKDNQTGRVIARMYLKNCSDKPLTSVLVGFKPHGDNGRIVSGMRDYLYDAEGVPVGEIFGDQTGILFDNNDTKSFSASVEEVDFEDGEYWDADEAKKKAEELKLIVPEEKEPVQQEQAAWEKPAEPVKAPEVWKSESAEDEPHSADIYGAAIVEQKMEAPVEEEFVPASLEARQYEHEERPVAETRQLEHEERPALEEETDAYRDDQEKAVIELDGPSDEEGPVIELGGPVEEEEPEPEPAEEAPIEGAEEVLAEEVEEEPEEEETPEEPAGPVRLADMYGGVGSTSTLASLAALYGMKNAEPEEEPAVEEVPEPIVEPEEEPAAEPEPETEPAEEAAPVEEAPVVEEVPEPVAEPEEEPAAEPETETEPAEEAAPAEEAPVVEEVPEPVAEPEEEPVAEPEPEAAPEPQEAEPEKPAVEEDSWAGYSADYAPPLGAVKKEAEAPVVEEKPEEPEAQEASVETPVEPEVEAAYEKPAEEVQPQEPEVQETPQETPADIPEEHIPTIEETIELPKAVVPEKSPEDASEILAPAAAKTEEEAAEVAAEAQEEAAEEVNPVHQKADVVFAQENEVIPSIIDNSNEKALTGEDHSGRNLLNIVVFGGIALIILLVLLIKM